MLASDTKRKKNLFIFLHITQNKKKKNQWGYKSNAYNVTSLYQIYMSNKRRNDKLKQYNLWKLVFSKVKTLNVLSKIKKIFA